MAYVDGFAIAVPRKKMKSYVKMAREVKKMWMKLVPSITSSASLMISKRSGARRPSRP